MHTRKAARSVILFLHCIGITGVQLPFILELDVDLWFAIDHDHTRLIVVFLIHQRFLDLLMHQRADLVQVMGIALAWLIFALMCLAQLGKLYDWIKRECDLERLLDTPQKRKDLKMSHAKAI